MLILQAVDAVAQAAQTGLLSRLGDQLFSISLLVVYAIYSMYRQRQIEDRLEKYMAEDREEMKKVIDNNTLVLRQISIKIQASVLVLACLLSFGFMSCSTSKKSVSKSVFRDSTSAVSSVRVKSSASYTKQTTIKDTTISIAARSVEDTFQIAELGPLYTADGKAVPNVKTITGKGIHGKVTALPGGGVAIQCTADSLQMVLNAMQQEVVQIQRDRESREFQARQKYYSAEISKITKQRATFITCIEVGFFVLLAAFIFFILYCVKKGVFRA